MRQVLNINGIIGLIPNESGEFETPNTTFLDVVNAVENKVGMTELHVFINSPGGLVEESDLIFDYLESVKAKGVNIVTHSEGVTASAAVKIFLVGNQRFIDSESKFMIHNPWGQAPEGDADVIEQYGKGLRAAENDMINFYSQQTGTSKEAIKPLMKQETFLTPEQAVELGFATEISKKIPLNAVAFSKKLNSNLNTTQKMSQTLTKKETVSFIDKLLAKAFGKSDEGPKGLKIQLDANGGEIEFPQLEENDTPSVGDETTAEDGSYVMPSGETYVIADGKLTEIIPAEEGGEGEGENEELAAANQKISDLEAELEQLKGMKEENESLQSKVKELAKGLETVKRSVSSNFQHKGQKKDLKKEGEESSRSLLKSED